MSPVKTALALLVVLVLAGCGSEGSEESSGTPDPNATLSVANLIGVSTWDPARSLGGPEIQLLSLVYDRLVYTDPSGNLKPGAAKSWHFDDGGSTLAMQLRDGLKFSDGTPITGEVVKQNIERALSLPESSIAPSMAKIANVQAEGNTIRIHQKEPDATLPALLSDRPGMIVNPATFEALAADDIPVGSGQLTVTKQQPGVSISFAKNGGHWNADTIKVANVELSVIADPNARLNAVRTGEVDIARIDADQAEDARAASELTLTTGPALETGSFFFNPSLQPAFAKPEVRQAISLAVDRNAIAQALLFGQAAATAQFYPEGHRAHVPELDQEVGADPDKARKLLADAGYPDGFTFEAIVYSPKMDRVAQAVQEQLKAVGITMNLKPIPSTNAITEWVQGKAAGAIFSSSPRTEPNLQFRTAFLPGQPLNPGNIDDSEVTRLIAASAAETDPEKRLAIDKQIS
ncbi:MAG TPA: ABC transporter substrate-binding protein [Nocardioides sp.]